MSKESRSIIYELCTDIRQWMYLARYARIQLPDGHPARPNEIGIKASEQLLERVAKHLQETFTIQGSGGIIHIDSDGCVLDIEAHRGESIAEEYTRITRFNVEEYKHYNDVLDDTDILLIGYWSKDGRYEPPVEEHRKLIASKQEDDREAIQEGDARYYRPPGVKDQ